MFTDKLAVTLHQYCGTFSVKLYLRMLRFFVKACLVSAESVSNMCAHVDTCANACTLARFVFGS